MLIKRTDIAINYTTCYKLAVILRFQIIHDIFNGLFITVGSYAKAGFKCALLAFSTKLTKDAQTFGYHNTPAFA